MSLPPDRGDPGRRFDEGDPDVIVIIGSGAGGVCRAPPGTAAESMSDNAMAART